MILRNATPRQQELVDILYDVGDVGDVDKVQDFIKSQDEKTRKEMLAVILMLVQQIAADEGNLDLIHEAQQGVNLAIEKYQNDQSKLNKK